MRTRDLCCSRILSWSSTADSPNCKLIGLLHAVRSFTDKPIRYLINSHDHSDHVFGNSMISACGSSKGSQKNETFIISHLMCKRRMEELFETRLEGYRNGSSGERLRPLLLNVSPSLPELTYLDSAMRINLEGQEMYLLHPETGAHTLGDTLLALPKSRVMFAGDVLWNGFYPNLEDANLEGWIDFLDDLDLSTYQKFVPGHGEICDSRGIEEFSGYLKQVRKNILAMNRTSSLDTKRRCFQVPGTESWKSEVDHRYERRSVARTFSSR